MRHIVLSAILLISSCSLGLPVSLFAENNKLHKQELKKFRAESFEFAYPTNLHVNEYSPGVWFLTHENELPNGGIEDTCGRSKDYLQVQSFGNFRKVSIYSKFGSVDGLVKGLEREFDNGKKISDREVNGLRVIGFEKSGAHNYYLIHGENLYGLFSHLCAGDPIPVDDLVHTFRVVK